MHRFSSTANWFTFLLILACSPIGELRVYGDEAQRFLGDWALRMPDDAAGWLRLERVDGQLRGELWTVGRPRKLTEVSYEQGILRFKQACRVGPSEYVGGPPTGPRVACLHRALVRGQKIIVDMSVPRMNNEAKRVAFEGRRMPPPPRRPDLNKVRYGKPITLFDGKSLAGWRLANPKQINGWKAVAGELVNNTPKVDFKPWSKYGNLRTDREFGDFKLEIEFNVPKAGNSGIYLRGQFEAQVVDRDSRMQGIQGVGAIFGRIAPAKNAGLPGGQWQKYQLTLVDRHITVVLNGEMVIDNQPLLGCTNGALSADITRPGPLYLQGDHTAVRYRNIVLHPVMRGPRIEP